MKLIPENTLTALFLITKTKIKIFDTNVYASWDECSQGYCLF